MRVLTSLDLSIFDDNSEYLGVSRLQLMENAGAAVARHVKSRLKGEKILILCGPGNNGGDGMVAARHLAPFARVTVALLARAEAIRTREARANFEALRSMASTVELVVDPCAERAPALLESADVIIDAIFGTGLKSEVRGPYRRAIEAVNNSGSMLKVAVDVPSGLDADTGEVLGVAVEADLTVTFHTAKPGLLREEAKRYVGELVVEQAGVPLEAELICGPGDSIAATKSRRPWSKKGDFGRVLIIGGSETYTGAPALTALASLRMGADLVAVAVPEQAAGPVRAFSPNLIVVPYEGKRLTPKLLNELLKVAEKFDVVAIGPGLGLAEETLEASLRLMTEFSSSKLMVIDADALKALATDIYSVKGGKVVLTPHAGELKAITGWSVGENVEERVEAAKRLSSMTGCTVLLKGHIDIVSDGERVKLNKTGNPGMTVGGTGDVLTGVTATFLAWTKDPFRAACAAAFVNGLAGDLVAMERGYHILATDLLDALPKAHLLSLNPEECKRVRPPFD
ncbi:MAG: NAD(P)H-hydrate dehydratase, partial [Thermofilaceae archaeon]